MTMTTPADVEKCSNSSEPTVFDLRLAEPVAGDAADRISCIEPHFREFAMAGSTELWRVPGGCKCAEMHPDDGRPRRPGRYRQSAMESAPISRQKNDWVILALTLAMRYDHYRLGKMIAHRKNLPLPSRRPKRPSANPPALPQPPVRSNNGSRRSVKPKHRACRPKNSAKS